MVTVGGFVLLVTGASTATGSVMLGIAVIYYIARFWPRRRP
jgi:hypothetical protein